MSNPGSAALSITSIAIIGTNSGDFAQTNTCGSSVAAGGSCTISVTFTPAAAGARSAAVSITDSATGSPHSIALSGTGLQAGAPSFYLRGNSSDVPSLANGGIVSPENLPAGLTGKVVVRGTGAATYAPLANGDGLSFTKGGQQNTNTAFLLFTGTPVSSLFNLSQGDLTFSMKSSHSFAERQTSVPVAYVFEVDDGTQRLFYFEVSAQSSRLVFYFVTGGASAYYYVPIGQEDAFSAKGWRRNSGSHGTGRGRCCTSMT